MSLALSLPLTRYPALSEEEEAISVPLQARYVVSRAIVSRAIVGGGGDATPRAHRRYTYYDDTYYEQALCVAIFDAILVHIVTTCSPDGTWLRL